MLKLLVDDSEISQKLYLSALISILLVTFLAFSNVIGGDFVADDLFYVVRNENIRSFNLDILLATRKLTINGTQYNLYRPFYIFTLAIEYAFFGLNPIGYHIVNIFLHSINSFLLYCLTLRYTNKKLLALLVALVFALHPIHTEAVSNITGLSEILSAFFMLLALWCYCSSKKFDLLYCFSLIFYILGITSKENGIVLIGVIILVDICSKWPNISNLKNKATYYIGYFFILLTYIFIKLTLRGTITTRQNMIFAGPVTDRVYTMSLVFIKYFDLLVWPSKLIAFYDPFIIPVVTKPTLPAIAAICFIFSLLISGFILLNYERITAFAILFFFGSISIVSNIFFDIGVIMAERFLYFPSISICLIIGTILYWLITKGNALKILGISLSIIILCLSVTRIYIRNLDWLSEGATNNAFIRDAPQSPRAAIMQYETAVWLFEHDRIDSAISISKEVVSKNPNYAQAHYKLGIMLQSINKQQEALPYFRRAKELKPDNLEMDLAYAISLLNNNLLNEAKLELEAIIKDHPNIPEAHNYLGGVYINLHLYPQAQKEFQTALTINPNFKAAELNLIQFYKIINSKD